jgi:hypothetical protein
VLVLELLSGQEVGHDKWHLCPYNILAHAVLARVLSRLSQGWWESTGPSSEVLYIGEDQVHQAQLGTEYTAHLIDKFLEDLVGFGPYRAQIIECG